ncbi:MAG: hypothetical protein ACE5GI_06515 [Candidatus Aminicenantales bacterium]
MFEIDNFRLYVYLPSENYKINVKSDTQRINRYIDKRARNPYFILRLGNTALVKKWKTIVNITKNKTTLYPHILRGFFAGEGNIKTGSNFCRQIRIAQKERNKLIENILNEIEVKANFSGRERAYVISSRYNWEKLAKIKIADLHPVKKEEFWKIYGDFKEWHYSHNFIRNNILSFLSSPKTSMELASMFKRDQTRLQRILTKLKRRGMVKNFRVGSKDYWIKSKNVAIISKRKSEILELLNMPRKTVYVANRLEVTWKAAFRRLKELEKLDLVKRKNNLWYLTQINKQVIVL